MLFSVAVGIHVMCDDGYNLSHIYETVKWKRICEVRRHIFIVIIFTTTKCSSAVLLHYTL